MDKQKLKNKDINLDHLLNRVHHLFFLTSGQCLIFDEDDNQIVDLQIEFVNGETNMWLLKLIAQHAEKITIGKFRKWMQEIDKDDFLRITHLNQN